MDALASEARTLVGEFADAITALEEANHYPDGIEGLELAAYARDEQLTALDTVRELGDRLEKLVADDLWPLPVLGDPLHQIGSRGSRPGPLTTHSGERGQPGARTPTGAIQRRSGRPVLANTAVLAGSAGSSGQRAKSDGFGLSAVRLMKETTSAMCPSAVSASTSSANGM